MKVTRETNIVVNNTSLAVEVSEAEIRNSAALVINALTGSNKTGETLKNERLSEDLLLAATVHAQLSKIDQTVAKRLINRIKPNYKKQLKDRNRQAIFRAVDEVLEVATKNNSKRGKTAKITKEQKKEILNVAFNKSQLDEKTNKLKRKVVEMPKTDSNTSNIDLTIEKVAANKVDSGKNLKQFRKAINSKPKLTKKQVKKQRQFLKEIDPKNLPEEIKPAPEKEVKPENKIEAPTHDDFVPTPDSMTFYPEKKGSPFFEVVLPEYRSKEIVDIGIFESNASDTAISDLVFSHFDGMGKAHWKADKPGSEMKNAGVMKFKFIDGSYDIRYFKPTEFFNTSYSY
ncbi:MAG: hypothetical protein KDD56_00620 [Bdellovibrionales bacterium]|nr:hypothetical protein [Bdellovibrionales bacterium]